MMDKHRMLWLLLLLPLLLSMACRLSAIRRPPTAATAIPTAPAATPTAVPTPTPTPLPPPPTEASPLGDVYVGSVELDMEALQQLQESVDQGHQPWRLDPLEVAQDEGEALGFDPANDVYELLSLVEMGEESGTGEAKVLVLHGEHLYIIHLIQPVRAGLGGIWAINTIQKTL
jgi:hypothetical protein